MGMMIVASTVFNERHKLPHLGSKPATLEGEEKEGCCGQTGTFWFSPWGNALARNVAGFAVCPRGATAVHQGPRLVTVPLWHFYSKPSRFFHLSHPAAVAGSVRTMSPSLCLPCPVCTGRAS